MKKRTARIIRNILLVVLLLAMIVAAVDVWYMTSADKRFIRAMDRGMYAGWQQSEPESSLRNLNVKGDASFIDAEYDAVKSFKNHKDDFRDETLGALAEEYISALDECRKVLKEKDPDKSFNKFWKKFSEPYGRRLRAICGLYNGGYGILKDMPEEYNEKLDDILLQGWALNKTAEINFKRGKSENELVAKVKNDSGHELDYMELTIDLYDAKGKLIETVTAYEADIKKDKSFKIRCYETTAGTAAEFVITAINCEKAD